MGCIFCRIINREIPAKIVFENERVFAFCDNAPQAPVHILIIPKEHIASLNDLTENHQMLIGEMQNVARTVAAQLGVAQSGYRVVVNCGADAGQAVDHIHYHLIGGRKLSWPPG